MATETPKRTAGAFDIRLIIAVLFFLYGLVLTVLGATASAEDVAKAAGLNINLWSGLGMLLFAVLFALWVKLRPLVVPDGVGEDSATEH
ncbi:hypothetical protein [Saccharopolyspora gloriosae]|uniref:hypothetical protein n=1 Tax=Saccharopolyspora gloriosae TaxID=455344 RepID=UPI001FB69C90|nr:hypothetical protein [Saccharopolyspora gloriosae]